MSMGIHICMDDIIDVFVVLATGRAFFAVRSGSLDSISTALSLTTQQSRPARTNSLDSLLLQSGSSRSRVEDGRRYVLLETGSVSSSRTLTADAEQRGSESNLTRSLPAAIERRVQCNSPRESRRVKNSRNPDGFSDNFVTADDEREARMNPRVSSQSSWEARYCTCCLHALGMQLLCLLHNRLSFFCMSLHWVCLHCRACLH